MRKSLGIVSTCLLATFSVFGQQYNISTVAGGAPLPNAPSAGSAPIGNPGAMASDVAGNIYFVSNNSVYYVSVNQLTRLAGNSRIGYSGDGGNATQAQLSNPLGIAVDSTNNLLYIADTGNNRIRKVTIATGVITTIAGLATSGYSGDNGQAAGAALNNPQGLAVDAAGNLYIADTGNNVIRRISAGIITTVAGNGTAGTSGDGQPATTAQLYAPTGVAVDAAGNLYIADSKNNRIREVQSSIMSTIAGTGIPGFAGDGNLATQAQLNLPTAVNVAVSGLIYLIDSGNARVRQIMPNRVISTVAGGGGIITNPQGITTDATGNLYIADVTHVILKFTPSGSFASFAGNGLSYAVVDGGPAVNAQLVQPQGLAVDATGIYIADRGEARVRKILSTGNISTPPGGTAMGPAGVAVDLLGNFYIADALGNQVLKVAQPSGFVTLVAGSGVAGSLGDNGLATIAQLNQPNGVAVDSAGNVYIADTANNKIRKVTLSGLITTIAGNGFGGFQGDNGVATNAVLNQPSSVAVDSAGNLFIADTGNNRIREISATTALITTVAGNGNNAFAGDGGPATSASIVSPHGVAVDSRSNLYITDYSGRVRKVSVSGFINTIAGTSSQGYSGDGGPALSAQFNLPWGITVDGSGYVYVSDVGAQAVRLLSPVATSPVSILTASPLPQGTVGTPYAQALSATGGTPPYAWSVIFGSLPSGLTLSQNGTINGIPNSAGSFLVTFQVTDSASITAQATIGIVINSQAANGLTITTPPTLVAGAAGIAYSQPLTAIAGNPPYNWTLVSGSLPVGLGLSPSGLISGSPVSAGTSTFTVRVNDISNAVATQTFTLQVISVGTPTLTGALSHIAAGGGWTTKAYLTNISTSPVVVNLVFYTDDGSILPFNVTQQGTTQPSNNNSFTGVMNPNTMIVVDTGAGLPNLESGWIGVLTSGATNPLAGFAVFRTVASNGTAQEGTTPLQTQFENKLDIQYDNTSGFGTAGAIANLSTTATTVTATVLDQNGNQIGTYTLTLQPNQHKAFLFTDPSYFAVSANKQGLVQFVSTSGGNLGGVGLRFNSITGTYTSTPIILP